MGYSQTWLAVRGGTAETVLPRLGLRATGEREDIAESPLVGAELPGDWYVVIGSPCDHPSVTQEAASKLSAQGDVVHGWVEEHVMVSDASHWRSGGLVWHVQHNAQDSIDHLHAEGELPPQYEAIRDGFAKQQLDAGSNPNVDHYFSIPLELARSLTGYMYDDDMAGIGAEPYEVLEIAGGAVDPAASKPWWKRFGGG